MDPVEWLARTEAVVDYGPIYWLDSRVVELLTRFGREASGAGMAVLADLARLEAASLRASPSDAAMAYLDGWPLFDPAGRAVIAALVEGRDNHA